MNIEIYKNIKQELDSKNVALIAVSKYQTDADVLQLYNAGQRHFAENKVQEIIAKKERMPADIHWHLIGHLQRNKVKYIAPFIYLIHSVDSWELLVEINKHALANKRTIAVLLQVYVSHDATKHGFDAKDLEQLIHSKKIETLTNVAVQGIMAMASLTDDSQLIQQEFMQANILHKHLLLQYPQATMLCMGMSSDYPLAITQGSNQVRLGSVLFQ